MKENKLAELSMDFAVDILKLIDTVNGHYSLKNQLERSATSIGANIREAKYAHSRADFVFKLQISLKECYETEYWLELLERASLCQVENIPALRHSCGSLRRMLIASINTAKKQSTDERKTEDIRSVTMNTDEKAVQELFKKWIKILRIENNWDVRLELIFDESFRKTGDLKIDCDDKKAIIMLNGLNPKQENFEEVICHELLHLKMYPLDQFTETLILSAFSDDEKAKDMAYYNFYTSLEITVEELTKCYLDAFGSNKELSYGRCREMKSFNDLYDGLKPLK